MGRDSNKSQIAWAAKSTKQFCLRLTENVDGDMITFLTAKGNVTGYLKQLIRADMEKNGCTVYMLVTKCGGNQFESCVSFSLEETRRMAEMELAHMAMAEKKECQVTIEGYQVPTGEGTAKELYNKYVQKSFETDAPVFIEEL